MAHFHPVHSRRNENSEARTEKVKRPKLGPAESEEVKERLECYEDDDDDDENLPFTNELKAMEVPVNFRMPIMDKYNERDDSLGPHQHIQDEAPGPIPRGKMSKTSIPRSYLMRRATSGRRKEKPSRATSKGFSNVINKIETVTDEKALDALVTGLHMRTLFWRNVQNSQLKTYSQLVDLIQREIRSEEMIENREKAEREIGD
ncbi:hypothetical protein Adt_34357 [Abeliophyllum distichum]|uniref:Uncharacterized protein n=1 Tax=Abeliophyllum distichum TaxID=126358 RepID=A0ABD1R197_9LAMI